jgi:hypothetical protein
MNAFVPYLAALHQQDLLQQAELGRRAKLVVGASNASVPAWRRSLSGLLASAAQSIDPDLQVERVSPLPSGRGADLQPAC